MYRLCTALVFLLALCIPFAGLQVVDPAAGCLCGAGDGELAGARLGGVRLEGDADVGHLFGRDLLVGLHHKGGVVHGVQELRLLQGRARGGRGCERRRERRHKSGVVECLTRQLACMGVCVCDVC
jgi:hypothetical protein